MYKYFENLVSIVGLIIGVLAFFFDNFSLPIKLLIFFIVAFITVLVTYIYSVFKCKKLTQQNAELIEENNLLKKQLSESDKKIKLQTMQLDSYRRSNDNDDNKITVI